MAAADVEGLPGRVALGLADADDRGQPGAPGGFGLLPHQGIAFTVIGATFGMADNDRAGAGIRQHFGREVAGVGAGRLGVAILGADRKAFVPRALSANAATSVAGGQTSKSALAATPEAPASMASNSARRP